MGRRLCNLPVGGREEDVAGIGHLMMETDPVDTAPAMVATVEAQVARLAGEDLQAVTEEVEAPQGVAQEGTRAALGAHRGTTTPFWTSCARWEKCSDSRQSTYDNVVTAIGRPGSRSIGASRRSRRMELRVCWMSSTLSRLRSQERIRRPGRSGP